MLLIQTRNKSIDPRYKLLKTIKDETISKVNSIINRYKAYKFDNIETRISMTPVLQYTNDHNLISSTDRILFAYLNRPDTNKVSQQDEEKHHVITSR